jgi:predicted Zn-dependent protease
LPASKRKRVFAVLKDTFILISVLGALFGLSFALISAGGKGRESGRLSLKTEELLKDLVREELEGEEDFITDEAVTKPIGEILARIEEREELHYPVEVIVVDSPVVNALTFPGGLVVLYSGLLKELESAEECAAVLAHEMGHIAAKDPLKAVKRDLGLSAVLLVVSGGQAQTLVQQLIKDMVSLRYSKEAERDADSFASESLLRASIHPGEYANALRRLKESSDAGAILAYLDPHDDIDVRIERAEAYPVPEGSAFTPIGVDWKALQRALPSLL